MLITDLQTEKLNVPLAYFCKVKKSQLKIGIFNLGNVGQKQLAVLLNCPEQFEILGFHENSSEIAALIQLQFGITRFEDSIDLLNQCDAIFIQGAVQLQNDILNAALRQGIHVFIENPHGLNQHTAKKYACLAQESGVIVFSAFTERFHPVYSGLTLHKSQPKIIEIFRGVPLYKVNEFSRTLSEQLIEDLDLALFLISSKVKKFSVNGTSGSLNQTNLACVRIDFDNDSMVNITLSKFENTSKNSVRIYLSNRMIQWNENLKTLTDINLPEFNKLSVFSSRDTLTQREASVQNTQHIIEDTTIESQIQIFYQSVIGEVAQCPDIQHSAQVFQLYAAISEKLQVKLGFFAHNI